MELQDLHEKPFFKIGDMVSFINDHGGLTFGEITSIDESTPAHPLVISFDDNTVRHFSLEGKFRGRSIRLIHQKK